MLEYFPNNSNSSPTFKITISSNGNKKEILTFDERKFLPKYFASFCIDLGFNSTTHFSIATVAVACQPLLDNECSSSPCIRTCCPPFHYFDVNLNTCITRKRTAISKKFKTSSDILLYSNNSDRIDKTGVGNRIILYGPPKCDTKLKSNYVTLNFTGYDLLKTGRVARFFVNYANIQRNDS